MKLLGRLMILTEDEAAMGSIFGVLSALPGTVGALIEVWHPASRRCNPHHAGDGSLQCEEPFTSTAWSVSSGC